MASYVAFVARFAGVLHVLHKNAWRSTITHSDVLDFNSRYSVLNWRKYRAICTFQLLEGGSTNVLMATCRSGPPVFTKNL